MELTPAHQLADSRRFLTQGDVDDLINLAMLIPEGEGVIDLGAGSGTTALAVLQTRPEVSMITVDISKDNLNWARLNLEANGINTDHWLAFHMSAVWLAKVFEFSGGIRGRKIGLLMHDADHSEAAVREDLEAWLPLLEPGAFVWVHDYLEMPKAVENYPGVKVVCDDFVERGFLKRVNSQGIGFIGQVIKEVI